MRTSLVVWLILSACASAAAPPDPVEIAIRRALRRLEQGATNYVGNRQCFSCHHQTLTIATWKAAKARGYPVSEELLKKQTEFTLDSFRPSLAQIRKGENIGGRSTTAAYALHTLRLAEHPADETTAALIDYLLVRQEKNGSWPAVAQRVPSEGSKFTNVALALAALKHFAPNDPTRRARHQVAYENGAAWLLKARPVDTEDRVFHLHGLIEIGAEQRRIDETRDELLGQQLADGSWRQIPERPGDAYATATVLLALQRAGVRPDSSSYRRGIAYLLRTQTDEGAWIVTTRNKPIQRWFDNGDPGGKHQFISFLSTGWATLALLESRPMR